MNEIMEILSGFVGLGLIVILTFEPFASFSSVLGPLGVIMVIGPHVKKEILSGEDREKVIKISRWCRKNEQDIDRFMNFIHSSTYYPSHGLER